MKTYDLLSLSEAEIGLIRSWAYEALHGENHSYVVGDIEATPQEMLERINQLTGVKILKCFQA